MELAYGLFMAEAEGYLDTREGRIQRSINEFVRLYNKGVDINLPSVQKSVFNRCQLFNLSNAELMQIRTAVENRI